MNRIKCKKCNCYIVCSVRNKFSDHYSKCPGNKKKPGSNLNKRKRVDESYNQIDLHLQQDYSNQQSQVGDSFDGSFDDNFDDKISNSPNPNDQESYGDLCFFKDINLDNHDFSLNIHDILFEGKVKRDTKRRLIEEINKKIKFISGGSGRIRLSIVIIIKITTKIITGCTFKLIRFFYFIFRTTYNKK